MIREVTALCWAVAIIMLAIGASTGMVKDDAARTLFIVLPLIAWMTLTDSKCCLARKAS